MEGLELEVDDGLPLALRPFSAICGFGKKV